jgi:hypothetical protein
VRIDTSRLCLNGNILYQVSGWFFTATIQLHISAEASVVDWRL